MHYLIEDPTYPLIALALAALLLLVGLQVTQQGKFLVWAGVVLGAAVALFVVERLVITDAERVEAVIYELADAVARSDVDAVASFLAPEVTFGRQTRPNGIVSIKLLLPLLARVHFDVLRVRQLQTQAGSQTKRGSAEFKVTASGTGDPGGGFGNNQPFAVANLEWSLGLREVAPQVWKVTRITPINPPRSVAPFLGGDF